MARKTITITQLLCDVCGAEIADDGPDPLKFAVNGREFRADLCQRHYDERSRLLERASEGLSPASARRGRRGGRGRAGGGRDLKAVREWARANGWPDLGDRGRVPAEVLEAYDQSH